MMLSTVNTATNNGNFTNNTVMYHKEENAHITDWQLKPIETTENDPSAPNPRKTDKSTKNSKPITHSADITSTFGVRVKWASTRVEETINRNKEKIEASRKLNEELIERQTNDFLAR